MPLTDQELAAFLWEQPRACEARGLHVWQSYYALGRRYQRLALGPYGQAQQVHVRFAPELNAYCVQVVLSTTGAIGARLYLQAKRQLSALGGLLRNTQGPDTKPPCLDCVLIGRRVEVAGNFVYALNLDTTCRAFTYRYDAAGLHFLQVPRSWAIPGSQQAPDLRGLAADLLLERADALAIYEAARADKLAALAALPPVDLADLVVTPTGVLAGHPSPGPVGQLPLFPPSSPDIPTVTTIQQRLGQLSQHVGGGKLARLAKAVGLRQQVLHNVVGKRQGAPGLDTLQQILTALPQVSPAWLVLGQGPMLTDTTC